MNVIARIIDAREHVKACARSKCIDKDIAIELLRRVECGELDDDIDRELLLNRCIN